MKQKILLYGTGINGAFVHFRFKLILQALILKV